jgi:hypothetical protein
VRTRLAVDAVEGLAEVVGERVGGGDDVRTGLDLDGAVAAGSVDESANGLAGLVSIQRLTARAANTIVRWASMESRRWW